jgi:hypothetical protein
VLSGHDLDRSAPAGCVSPHKCHMRGLDRHIATLWLCEEKLRAGRHQVIVCADSREPRP